MDEWLSRPASDLGREIGARRIDPRDLTEAFLGAIDAHPERDRIYARTTPERARTEAVAAAGRARDERRAGPLDGVPISWKDLYDVAGVGCEGGCRLLAGRVPDNDCTVVQRGARAGTICLGKTHTTELAFSGLGINPITATPPNAIEAALAPGGSSSGAAVSTKLGLAAAGIGSDTGGSVRVPAGWNDLVGLKTTAGLIPTEGVIALCRSYDTVGPLTHTVEDAANLFAILADRPVAEFEDGALGDESLYVAETVVLDDADDGIGAAHEEALSLLSAGGAKIARGPVPEFAGVYQTMAEISPVVPGEAWGEWGDQISANPGTLWPPIEFRFRMGENADPERDAEAREEFDRLSQSIQDRMAGNGLIVLPTAPIFPPDAKRLEDDQDYFTERNLLALRNTRLANLLTLSSITIPTRTPMCGLMVFGPPHAEDRLLRIGQQIERVMQG